MVPATSIQNDKLILGIQKEKSTPCLLPFMGRGQKIDDDFSVIEQALIHSHQESSHINADDPVIPSPFFDHQNIPKTTFNGVDHIS